MRARLSTAFNPVARPRQPLDDNLVLSEKDRKPLQNTIYKESLKRLQALTLFLEQYPSVTSFKHLRSSCFSDILIYNPGVAKLVTYEEAARANIAIIEQKRADLLLTVRQLHKGCVKSLSLEDRERYEAQLKELAKFLPEKPQRKTETKPAVKSTKPVQKSPETSLTSVFELARALPATSANLQKIVNAFVEQLYGDDADLVMNLKTYVNDIIAKIYSGSQGEETWPHVLSMFAKNAATASQYKIGEHEEWQQAIESIRIVLCAVTGEKLPEDKTQQPHPQPEAVPA